LSGILKAKFGDVGFTVDIAVSAADAVAALELINYDAAVLDLGLPDGDGLAVLAAVRRISKTLSILILTARDAVEERVGYWTPGSAPDAMWSSIHKAPRSWGSTSVRPCWRGPRAG